MITLLVVAATVMLILFSVTWVAHAHILRRRRAQPLDPRGVKAIYDAEEVILLSQWWVLLSLAVLAVSALVM